MSYKCGLNFPDLYREPCLVCDGCGLERTVTNRNGIPFSWFLDRKKAPGWSAEILADDIPRKDWCPTCTKVRKKK